MPDMKYVRPRDLDEALNFLDLHGPDTEILAGGTDVMVDLRSGLLNKTHLLDVSRLNALKTIEMNEEGLGIGAGVTLTEINASPVIRTHAPALWKSSCTFASRQIRNMATIGGNVAHASPCGDTIPPLMIHGARAVVANSRGIRLISMDAVVSGAYQSALSSKDVIVKFILKPGKGGFSDFQKIGRRRALAISRMSMAVMADKDEEGRISSMDFALGACTPTPHAMDDVESLFKGRVPTPKLIQDAGEILTEKMIEITGRRPSILYKEPAVKGLFMRMIHPMVEWCEK